VNQSAEPRTPHKASWRLAIVSRLGALALRALGRTWRVTFEEGADPSLHRPGHGAWLIAGVWHRNLLMAAYLFRDHGICVGVSQSRDGDMIAGVLERMGYAPSARGSSSRGGVTGLRALVRNVRRRTPVCLVIDGPRGPAFEAKTGMTAVAALARTPIYPVAFSCNPAWRFHSWDRTLLPLPFAKVRCAIGEPLQVPEDVDETARETIRARLQQDFLSMSARLDAEVGASDPRLHEATK
jgi:lysophospholipid acyltransferase (LPLAT)-like uncharacterized protein